MKIKGFLLVCFSLLALSSCNNEDLDDLFKADVADLIAEDSELFGLLERATTPGDATDLKPITCIRFIYSFTVVIYDENTELETSQIVSNDAEFSALLGSVPEGKYVGVSFPITSQLEDGSTFEVANKEELKIAIDACVQEEQDEAIGECEGLLQTCVWEVQLPDGNTAFDTYENAVFAVDADGTVDFFHRGAQYDGTWIVYFIEDELHININIDDDRPTDPYNTEADWNFDWKTEIVDAQTMNIEIDGGKSYVLKQRCEVEEYCTTFSFVECEGIDTPGFTEFILENYIDCIDIMASPEPIQDSAPEMDDTIDYIFTFHLTEVDADTNVNALDTSTPYINITNPQEIYVRIEHPDTQEYLIVVISLVVVSCP